MQQCIITLCSLVCNNVIFLCSLVHTQQGKHFLSDSLLRSQMFLTCFSLFQACASVVLPCSFVFQICFLCFRRSVFQTCSIGFRRLLLCFEAVFLSFRCMLLSCNMFSMFCFDDFLHLFQSFNFRKDHLKWLAHSPHTSINSLASFGRAPSNDLYRVTCIE